MMTYVFEPSRVITLPIQGQSDQFPVNRVYCVGRNYADHTIEMGGDPSREEPFFFKKSPDNIVLNNGVFPYPSLTQDVHHEVEMVVALGSGGKNITEADALNHVYGYGVGLDMTRRDLQGAAKKAGRPWDTGKAFDYSAPCGDLIPAAQIGHLSSAGIWLDINGERRQEGNLDQMIWKIPEMIAYLSTLFTLSSGDLIMTGTPAGVGPVVIGDELHAHVDGLPDLKITVGDT